MNTNIVNLLHIYFLTDFKWIKHGKYLIAFSTLNEIIHLVTLFILSYRFILLSNAAIISS